MFANLFEIKNYNMYISFHSLFTKLCCGTFGSNHSLKSFGI